MVAPRDSRTVTRTMTSRYALGAAAQRGDDAGDVEDAVAVVVVEPDVAAIVGRTAQQGAQLRGRQTGRRPLSPDRGHEAGRHGARGRGARVGLLLAEGLRAGEVRVGTDVGLACGEPS